MSVLFSDIRDFTAIAEGNSPENNFKFINDYLKRMGPVIRDHNGFIDKYIGDGILALFEHADDAVRAGLAMIAELENFNRERSEPVEIGIGIHTGTHHARHNRRRASHGKHCDRRHGQLSIAH